MKTYTLYQNKRNPHKFIELIRYSDGHYYWRQYISRAGVVNYTTKRYARVTKSTFLPVLTEDYQLFVGYSYKGR